MFLFTSSISLHLKPSFEKLFRISSEISHLKILQMYMYKAESHVEAQRLKAPTVSSHGEKGPWDMTSRGTGVLEHVHG